MPTRTRTNTCRASAERLAWLTGFTGSAGTAIVLADKAAIFVDGRYTLQARAPGRRDTFTPEHLIETPPADMADGACSRKATGSAMTPG